MTARKNPSHGMISSAIRDLLRSGRKTTREIATAINKHSQEVTPWLYRLKKQGEVRKVSNADRGRYGLRSSIWEAVNFRS